ncbi:MAG TPA: competence/damage-inducible protein A, partial [Candidatus Wunengus sp. YC60]|uniref:competence/damage-inducible protein A n=1 Tax=Candidatus Wunengus sp. YC60 TaxID=3367697 RepID=UPI004028EC19
MTTAEIITIGTEIVLGQIVDTNASYIARKLTEDGIRVLFQTSVGDDKGLLKSALKIASDRANLIITTGGLGPTENDITRETISELFDIPLVPDKEAYVHIQKHLVNQHPNVQDGYKKQVMIPEGAVVIHNENGTATGFAIQHGDTDIVCLPGVPREMQSMLNKYLEIYAEKHRSEEGCTLTRDIHTFGISERAVEDQIKAMTLVHDGIVTVNILATAVTR